MKKTTSKSYFVLGLLFPLLFGTMVLGLTSSSSDYESLKADQKSASGCGNAGKLIHDGIMQNFDPRRLSNPNCKAALKITFTDDGIPVSEILRAEHNSPTDDFYCRQAVWEYAVKLGWRGTELLCEFSPEVKAGSHPEILNDGSSQYVLLHLIPASFGALGMTFPKFEISSPDNVLKLKLSMINDSRLDDFRREWFKFFAHHTPLSYEDIKSESVFLKQKYADLFIQ